MSEQDKSKKDWLTELLEAGIIDSVEGWDNLSIKQCQFLSENFSRKLDDSEKDELAKNYVESIKEKATEIAKEEIKVEYLKELKDSENADLVSEEIVKRRRTEQETKQLKQSIRAKLDGLQELLK